MILHVRETASKGLFLNTEFSVFLSLKLFQNKSFKERETENQSLSPPSILAGWALPTGTLSRALEGASPKAGLGEAGRSGSQPHTTPRGQEAMETGQVDTDSVGSLPAWPLPLSPSWETLVGPTCPSHASKKVK